MLENLLLHVHSSRDAPITTRYVRLDKLKPKSTAHVAIWELEIIGNGINFCREPGAVASALTSYPGQPPSGLIDGFIDLVAEHRWTTSSPFNPATSTQWCQVDLGTIRTFDTIKIASDGFNGQGVVEFDLLVSDDGVNFSFVKNIKDLVWPVQQIPDLQIVYGSTK